MSQLLGLIPGIPGMPNIPIDEDVKREVKEICKAILGTFTLNYVKYYGISMVLQIQKEMESEPDEWKLEERPDSEDQFLGYAVKQGGSRKTWKKRYFVVRSNYMVEYYKNEEHAKSGEKKKGCWSLAGYRVVEDVNNTRLKKIRDLAEKFGLDVSKIPKGKQYPMYTIMLQHKRRRCFYVQCENEEDFKKYCEVFRTCCYKAHGLKNQEYCHHRAFKKAIKKTYESLDYWRSYDNDGSEEQILGELIADEIDSRLMVKLYEKIQGPWKVRRAIHKQLFKILETIVNAAVGPAWHGMEKAVQALRPKLEPKLKELAGPVFKKKAELTDKIQSGAASIIDPLLKEFVLPHMTKILAIIKLPMNEAFAEAITLFEEEVGRVEMQQLTSLDYLPNSYKLWPALGKTDLMREPLWALSAIFSSISPETHIWNAKDTIRKLVDNALYTLEKNSKDIEPAAYVELRAKILEDFRADAETATNNYYHDVLSEIVMPPFEGKVFPAVSNILDPITSLIPEDLQDFLDPAGMLQDLVTGIIDHTIDTVLEGNSE